MKKILVTMVGGLFISAIPMVGAYIFYNGSEWIRAADGSLLTLSCVFVMMTILAGILYYITE